MSSLLKSPSVSDSARARLLHVLRTSFAGGAPSAVDSVSDSAGDDLPSLARAQPIHSVFIFTYLTLICALVKSPFTYAWGGLRAYMDTCAVPPSYSAHACTSRFEGGGIVFEIDD